MNSVERIKEYELLPQEADEVVEGNRPPPDWPNKGKVEFQKYSFAYRKASAEIIIF
jgi:ABC-type multidrug transport system fused ATPase/permease subunit